MCCHVGRARATVYIGHLIHTTGHAQLCSGEFQSGHTSTPVLVRHYQHNFGHSSFVSGGGGGGGGGGGRIPIYPDYHNALGNPKGGNLSQVHCKGFFAVLV